MEFLWNFKFFRCDVDAFDFQTGTRTASKSIALREVCASNARDAAGEHRNNYETTS